MKSLPQRVSIIGAGTVGASMCLLCGAHGMHVSIYDPDADSVLGLRKSLESAGLDSNRLAFHASAREACKNTEFVYEAGPERLEIKRGILRDIDSACAPDIVIATATSSLLVADLQPGLAHPQRVLAAHPFNPPHLIPLVEIAGSATTSERAIQWAFDFFRLLDRHPIRLKREAVGHIANRLTAALYREAVHIVAAGIATVADVDDAVRFGPGLRWAIVGPHMSYHLGAGNGGYAKYLSHLGPAQEARWRELGAPALTEQLKAQLVSGVEVEAAGRDIATLARQRDQALAAVLEALSRQEIFRAHTLHPADERHAEVAHVQ